MTLTEELDAAARGHIDAGRMTELCRDALDALLRRALPAPSGEMREVLDTIGGATLDKDDALFQLLVSGKATRDDQEHAARWISRLYTAVSRIAEPERIVSEDELLAQLNAAPERIKPQGGE